MNPTFKSLLVIKNASDKMYVEFPESKSNMHMEAHTDKLS